MIIGFIKLKNNLKWNKNILGEVFDAKIGENTYKIYFPLMPNTLSSGKDFSLTNCLESPSISKNLRQGNKKIYFGQVLDYPLCTSYIEKLVISPNENDTINVKENILYDHIDSWINKLIKILTIMTNTISLNLSSEYKGHLLQLLCLENNQVNTINNPNGQEITILSDDNVNPITKEQFQTTIKLLNSNIEIPLSYEYYLNAVKSYEMNNYRNCVLDCSTAVEIAITNKIILCCQKNGIKDYIKLLEGHNGIINKSRLLIAFKANKDFNFKLITKPRNEAIHSGNIIDKQSALICLQETRKLLDDFEKFY